MADLKISQMTKATVLSGEELIPIVQNGTNKSADVNLIRKDLATETWVQDQINDTHKVLVVQTLPAEGLLNRIYLVPNDATRPNDIYDEYIWLGPTDKWEFLGNKQVTIDLSAYYTKTDTDDKFVAKEANKGLSTNDFTDTLKTKLDGLSNYNDTAVKTSISDEVTRAKAAEKVNADAITALGGTVNNKVDKVNGKQLSTEDYTTSEKTKLGGIADSANNYVHPTTAGNRHIPAGGAVGQVLVNTGDGVGNWQTFAPNMDLTGFEEIYTYGVEWDTTVADPTLTRIGNPLLHKSLPVQSQYKGCVANNDVVNYYLYPNDWAFKEDGVTPSVLDGTDGTVRVHTPKFYGKSGADGNKRWVRISAVRINDTWTEIPAMLIDAYRSTVDTTVSATPKAVSVVNTTAAFRGGGNRTAYDTHLDTDVFRSDLGKPRTSVTRATMRTYAKNAGSELLCYEYYKWIFYWAWVIEYATFNSQATYNANLTSDGYHQGGLGAGVTTMNGTHWSEYNGYYPLTPCGFGNDIGNFTGVKTYEVAATTNQAAQTMSMPRWRGFDNPFGDIWTNLDGIIIQGYTEEDGTTYSWKNVYTTTDPTKFGDTEAQKTQMTIAGKQWHNDGYIKAFDLGEKAEIIPSAVGGGSTTYMCDYSHTGSKDTTLRTLIVGGSADYGTNAGLGYFNSHDGVGLSNATVGFRTLNKV